MESEARYRAIFEGSADGILIADVETMKFELEKNKTELENSVGYTQIYRICDYTMGAISGYYEYAKKIDNLIELY